MFCQQCTLHVFTQLRFPGGSQSDPEHTMLHTCLVSAYALCYHSLACSSYLILDLQIMSWSTGFSFSRQYCAVRVILPSWWNVVKMECNCFELCYQQQPYLSQSEVKWIKMTHDYISNNSDGYSITPFIITIYFGAVLYPIFHMHYDMCLLLWSSVQFSHSVVSNSALKGLT